MSERTSLYRFLGLGSMALAILLVGAGAILWGLNPGLLGLQNTPPLINLGEPDKGTCTTPPQKAGTYTETIMSVGLERSYIVHLPPSYGRDPQPLLINYHGYSQKAAHFLGSSHMNEVADKNGFIAVYPQGSEEPSSWNAGVGAYGPTAGTDDVQFTRDLLDTLQTKYCVDARRVYMAGFSLGGGMAYRIACAMSDRIAAIATVAGAYYPFPEECQPSRPVPVVEIHGELDADAPYTGNPSLYMAGVQEYLDGWVERNGCEGEPQVFFQQGSVTGIEWTTCAEGASVRHYRASDGGHAWAVLPANARVIDTATVMWEFLNKYSLPEPEKSPTATQTVTN